jgi:hypothetical protein
MNGFKQRWEKRLERMLPVGAGICAFDVDECTVTLALDNCDEVKVLVDALPAKSRVRLAGDL